MIDWRTDVENAPHKGDVLLFADGFAYIGEWDDGGWSGPGWYDGGEHMPIDGVTHWAVLNLPGQT